MDEVLKAMDSRQDPETSIVEEDTNTTKSDDDDNSSLTDKSPLIDREPLSFSRQDSAFDNFGMSADDLSTSRDNDTDSLGEDEMNNHYKDSKESTPESKMSSDLSYTGSSAEKKNKAKLKLVS